MDPLAYCDEMERVFTSVWKRLDVSYDDFIRTTDAQRHKPAVQKMAQACYDAGDIYEGVYEGWYCVSCEAFKQEKDLVDGHCPVHPTIKPEWIREKNWFFRLSKYQQPLLDHYAAHPSFIEPEVRRNEILRLVEAGLEDISVSRAGQSWGIPLPFDPQERRLRLVRRAHQLRGGGRLRLGRRAVREVVAGQSARHRQGHHAVPLRDLAGDADEREAAAAGRRCSATAGFRSNGQRMSKSLGNVVDPVEAAERFGVDPLRLYLVKEVPYGGDGDFTWERLGEKYNADLANNLGNLVSRVAAMTERYRGGHLAAPRRHLNDWRASPATAVADYRRAMDTLACCTTARRRRSGSSMRPTCSSPRRSRGRWPKIRRRRDRLSARACGVGGSRPHRGRAAAAGDADVRRGDPAPHRRVAAGVRAAVRSRHGLAHSGEKRILNEGPLWPRETRHSRRDSDLAVERYAESGSNSCQRRDSPTASACRTPQRTPGSSGGRR